MVVILAGISSYTMVNKVHNPTTQVLSGLRRSIKNMVVGDLDNTMLKEVKGVVKELLRRVAELRREGAEKASEIRGSFTEKTKRTVQDASEVARDMKQGLREGTRRKPEEAVHGAKHRVHVARKWVDDLKKKKD